MKRNIILIGFMGCGKTSVGQILAEKQQYMFMDTDQVIEQNCGMSISNLFATMGEEYFRNIETETLEQLILQAEGRIIATGGGMPLRQQNQKLLRQLGMVVYLKTSKDSILTRLQGDCSRPLLQGDNMEKKIEFMLESRDQTYEEASDFVVVTDGKTLEELAEEIAELSIEEKV